MHQRHQRCLMLCKRMEYTYIFSLREVFGIIRTHQQSLVPLFAANTISLLPRVTEVANSYRCDLYRFSLSFPKSACPSQARHYTPTLNVLTHFQSFYKTEKLELNLALSSDDRFLTQGKRTITKCDPKLALRSLSFLITMTS